jgi:hypothetical protein
MYKSLTYKSLIWRDRSFFLCVDGRGLCRVSRLEDRFRSSFDGCGSLVGSLLESVVNTVSDFGFSLELRSGSIMDLSEAVIRGFTIFSSNKNSCFGWEGKNANLCKYANLCLDC